MAYAKRDKNRNTKANKRGERPASWKDVCGRMTVFGHDNGNFINYTTAISRKTESGYEDVWVSVLFPKKAKPDIDERFEIDMKGFMSVRSWDDDRGNHHALPCVYVQEYDFVEE